MHSVKSAKYIEDYKIVLMFENNIEKIVDLFPHLYGEIFEPLKDVSNFKRFKVNKDTDTIEWENGADMSPDFLYKIGKDFSKNSVKKAANKSKKPVKLSSNLKARTRPISTRSRSSITAKSKH